MTRIVLLIIFGLVAAYYFPDSRRVMVDTARPLWVPVQKWNTKQEMRQVAGDLVQEERETGQLPDREHWKSWLEYRYSLPDSWEDAWGSMYDLKVWPDSIGIVSHGPDRKPDTDDDFMVVEARHRPDRPR